MKERQTDRQGGGGGGAERQRQTDREKERGGCAELLRVSGTYCDPDGIKTGGLCLWLLGFGDLG